MARIIVTGAGLGGVACAYEMKKTPGKSHDVTLVCARAFSEFTLVHEKHVLSMPGIEALQQ